MPLTADQQQRLDRLAAPEMFKRVNALRSFVEAPDPAPEFLAAVEALLEDHTPVITQIPYRYGELRTVAAEAAAALRFAQKREDPVVLDPYYPTLSIEKIADYARNAGVGDDAPFMPVLERYAWLREHGHLPGTRMEFHPLRYGQQ